VNWRSDWFANTFKFVRALTGLWRGSAPDRSDLGGPTRGNGAAETAASGADDTATERQIEISTVEIVAATEAETGARIDTSTQDRPESDQRRELIRTLFNDFWTGIDEKPVTFAERLDAAEEYINARLAQRPVNWRLDPETRKQLGLPMSPAAPN
jgi:hypothetical protein